MIVVAADSPYKTLKGLVEAHKADPSGFAVAGGGAVGSGDAAEMVKHHVAGKVRILAVMAPEFTRERDARGLFDFTLIGSAFDARVKQDVERFKVLANEAGM